MSTFEDQPETVVETSSDYHYQDAISQLEDHGYSYNFSMGALASARVSGRWVNVMKIIRVEYVGDDVYRITRT